MLAKASFFVYVRNGKEAGKNILHSNNPKNQSNYQNGGIRMKWNPQDIDVYTQSKEFVDTALVPLLPVTFGDEMKQAAAMAEFINLLTMQLERQFRGRLLLLPGFTYLKSLEEDKLANNLARWENEILSQGFSHIFYVTSDIEWKSREKQLSGSLLWLPTVSFGTMKEQEKMAVIEDQVKQLLSLFIQKWRQKE